MQLTYLGWLEPSRRIVKLARLQPSAPPDFDSRGQAGSLASSFAQCRAKAREPRAANKPATGAIVARCSLDTPVLSWYSLRIPFVFPSYSLRILLVFSPCPARVVQPRRRGNQPADRSGAALCRDAAMQRSGCRATSQQRPLASRRASRAGRGRTSRGLCPGHR